MKIDVKGLDALCSFQIKSNNFLKYKTYITQEMLKNGFLATNTIYVSTEHSNKILNRYFKILDKIFYKIHLFEKKEMNINKNLDSGISEPGFRNNLKP